MCYEEGRGIVPPPEFVPVGVLTENDSDRRILAFNPFFIIQDSKVSRQFAFRIKFGRRIWRISVKTLPFFVKRPHITQVAR